MSWNSELQHQTLCKVGLFERCSRLRASGQSRSNLLASTVRYPIVFTVTFTDHSSQPVRWYVFLQQYCAWSDLLKVLECGSFHRVHGYTCTHMYAYMFCAYMYVHKYVYIRYKNMCVYVYMYRGPYAYM